MFVNGHLKFPTCYLFEQLLLTWENIRHILPSGIRIRTLLRLEFCNSHGLILVSVSPMVYAHLQLNFHPSQLYVFILEIYQWIFNLNGFVHVKPSQLLTLLFCIQNPMIEGAVFVDCGSDLGSGRHVPGQSRLKQYL